MTEKKIAAIALSALVALILAVSLLVLPNLERNPGPEKQVDRIERNNQ